MSKKDIKRAKSLSLLEETKHRLRLEQEARTIARIEQLQIQACDRLQRQLQLGQLEPNRSGTDTVRQSTLYVSDSEKNLISEQNSSSTDDTVRLTKSSKILETPD